MKSYKIIFLLFAIALFGTSCGMFGGKTSAKKPPHDGLFLVEKIGVNDYYIDRTGKKILDCPDKDCTEFSEGVATARNALSSTESKKWKFFDKTGKILFEGEYEKVEPFSDGMAIVTMKDPAGGVWDKYGAIDMTGKMVVEAKYDDLQPFSDGLALVGKKPGGKGMELCPADCKYGYMDKTGKIVVDMQYGEATPFSDGYAAVKKDFYSDDARFIDKTGKETNWHEKLRYTKATRFSEGMAAVKVPGDGWIFINTSGEPAFELKDGLKFEEVRPFSEGWAAVKLDPESKTAEHQAANPWTFINTSGKPREGISFEEVGDFSEGFAAVKRFGKWSYIKPDETSTDDFDKRERYEKSEPYGGGLARVEKSNSKEALVDTTGKVIWEEE